jgi:hypothetical protein
MISREYIAKKLFDVIMKHEDVEGMFYSLYVHEKAHNPFGIIHFENDNNPTRDSLFSLEQYDGKNVFHLISQTSVRSDIRLLLDEYQDDKLLAKERRFKRIQWLRKFAQSFKEQFKEEVFYNIVNSRMDAFRIVMDKDGNFIINLQYSIYSEHTSAVSCYFDFDSDFNLISINIGDNKLSNILAKLQDKKSGFEFLINYHTHKKTYDMLKDSIDISKELNDETLAQYAEIIKMVEI